MIPEPSPQADAPAGAGNSIYETREAQMFPVFTPAQIETATRFASGPPRRFAPNESAFATGEIAAPCWLVLAGTIDVTRRDGLDLEAPIVTHGIGQFTGEVSQLAGRASIAAGRAGPDGCTALPFDAAHLRALMIGSAEIGEIVMRALILRRVGLIEHGGAGTILIGAPTGSAMVRLQGFLARNGYPNMVMDIARDPEARTLAERTGVSPADLPLVVCPNGRLLRDPTEAELAACLGLVPRLDAHKLYDVAIVGAGPAGLAAAVYAASEGLSAIVLDTRAMGGQAGASARIENYLGFPTGISGQALAGRAYNQALKFGAEIAIPAPVEKLDCQERQITLSLAGDRHIRARTIVIASGAHYRKLDVPGLARYEGTGINYWASPIEARLCAGQDIALVGGGNSAGQAIVFLAPQVRDLHLFVRHPLAETMSRYLIERIAALPNVHIHVGSNVIALDGESRLEGLRVKHADGSEERVALHHLFLFIGADPNTAWLNGCVALDGKGFVITGDGRPSLATTLPGVFAIGDVRAGSVKRVAAAVGEGAAVVSQIHTFLGSAS